MEKIKYIIGNKEHAKDIRDYFDSIDEESAEYYTYGDSELAYFINPETKYVDFLDINEWQFKTFVRVGIFEELKYPYVIKPKLQVIRGVYNRGSEVIKLLKSLGGKNMYYLEGILDDTYYFIDSDCDIVCENMTSDTFKGYDLKILSLPEKSTKPTESAVVKFPDKEPLILEPFVTRVLVRNDNKHDRWIAGIYVNTIDYNGRPYVNIVGSDINYTKCILYQGNEHLAFTHKNPEPANS